MNHHSRFTAAAPSCSKFETDPVAVFFVRSVPGDGNRSVLERLPLPVCSEVPEAGRVSGQPKTPSQAGIRAAGAAAG